MHCNLVMTVDELRLFISEILNIPDAEQMSGVRLELVM